MTTTPNAFMFGSDEDKDIAKAMVEAGMFNGMFPATISLTKDEAEFMVEAFQTSSIFMNDDGMEIMSVIMHKLAVATHGRDKAEALWRASFPANMPPPEPFAKVDA